MSASEAMVAPNRKSKQSMARVGQTERATTFHWTDQSFAGLQLTDLKIGLEQAQKNLRFKESRQFPWGFFLER